MVKDPDQERICLYIVGASGSGKSYWTTQFVKQYKLTNKTKKIYLISPIIDDKNINSLKPIRLNLKVKILWMTHRQLKILKILY